MKAPEEKRTIQLHFLVSDRELSLLKERMEQTGINNLSAYLRKMALDGYILNLDLSDVRELIKLLRSCSNNLNQYTRKAHETGNIYAADIEDLHKRLEELRQVADLLLDGLANIP